MPDMPIPVYYQNESMNQMIRHLSIQENPRPATAGDLITVHFLIRNLSPQYDSADFPFPRTPQKVITASKAKFNI